MIDLLKMSRPDQFPKDEILNNDERLVRSWMSVDVRDKQGDRIPIEAFKKVMNTWFKRGATMIDQHSNRPIGKGLTWKEETHPQSGKQGIILDWQCFKDYDLDDQVWEEVKDGTREGLSIGARAKNIPKLKFNSETGEHEKFIPKIELYEVSPVKGTANQLAQNIAINYLAKSSDEDPAEIEKKLVEDLKKGYVVKEENSYFGGFDNLEECSQAQEAKGHSPDGAKRVCTFIQHQSNKNFEKGKMIKKADGMIFKPGEKVVVGPYEDNKYNLATVISDQKSGVEVEFRDGSKEVTDKDNVNFTYEVHKKGKTINKGVEEYNWDEDEDNIAYIGLKTEMEEHPELDEKAAKQLVADHLNKDPNYYTDKKAEFKKRCKNKENTVGSEGTEVSEGTINKEDDKTNEIIKALMQPKIEKSDVNWPSGFVKTVLKRKL